MVLAGSAASSGTTSKYNFGGVGFRRRGKRAAVRISTPRGNRRGLGVYALEMYTPTGVLGSVCFLLFASACVCVIVCFPRTYKESTNNLTIIYHVFTEKLPPWSYTGHMPIIYQ